MFIDASQAEKKAGISLGVKGASAPRVIKKRRAKRVGYARDQALEGQKDVSPAASPQLTPETSRKTAQKTPSSGSLASEGLLDLPPPSEMRSEPPLDLNGASTADTATVADGDGAKDPPAKATESVAQPDLLQSVMEEPVKDVTKDSGSLKGLSEASAGPARREETNGAGSGAGAVAETKPKVLPESTSTQEQPTTAAAAEQSAASDLTSGSRAKADSDAGADGDTKRKGGKFLSFFSDKLRKKGSKSKLSAAAGDAEYPRMAAQASPGAPLPAPGVAMPPLTAASSVLPSAADAAQAKDPDAEAEEADDVKQVSQDPVERASAEVSRTVFDFEVQIRKQIQSLEQLNRELVGAQSKLQELGRQQEEVDRDLIEKESEQSRLAEKEEYEEAEALNPLIEGLQTRKRGIVEELSQSTQACDHLEKERKVGKKKIMLALEELAKDLRSIESKEESRVRDADADTIKALDQKSRQLNSEEERIKLTESSNSRKERDLDDEESAVDAQIRHLTKDLTEEQEVLSEKQFTVDAEIEDLRRQLDAKLRAKGELSARQDEIEDGIRDVRKKFERQIQRLQEERRGLEVYKKECEEERQQLEEEKLEAARQKDLMLSVQQRFESLRETVQADVTAASTLRDAIHQRRENQGAVASEEDHEAKIHALRLAAAEAEEAVHEAQTALEEATEQLNALRDEGKRLRQRLPQVEQLKKAAAKARNFKEAGAYAAEFKQSEQRLEELEKEEKAVQQKLLESEPQVEIAQTALVNARKALKDGEQKAEVGNYTRLHDVIRSLKKARRRALQSKAKGETPVLLSKEVANAIDLLFDEEIAEVQAEVNVLKSRYDFDDIALDDDEEDADAEEAAGETAAGDAGAQDAVAGDGGEEAGGAAEGVKGDDGDAEEAAEEAVLPQSRSAEFEEELHELRRLNAELTAITTRIDAAVDDEDFDLAAELEPQREQKEEELQAFLTSHTITLEDLEHADKDEAVEGATEIQAEEEEEEEASVKPSDIEDAEAHAEETSAAEGSAQATEADDAGPQDKGLEGNEEADEEGGGAGNEEDGRKEIVEEEGEEEQDVAKDDENEEDEEGAEQEMVENVLEGSTGGVEGEVSGETAGEEAGADTEAN
eukprot:scaffold53_cov193-Pinguiococcus_pyrenoidosus.AAC.26